VAGDGDFDEDRGLSSWEEVENGFLSVPGVKKITIEAESGPGEGGPWVCLGYFGIEVYE
jgi:hypothetical protein